MKTYNIVFNDSENSNDLGLKENLEYCRNWIHIHNGTNWSYFEDYKGGEVSIVCNESGEVVHSENIQRNIKDDDIIHVRT